MRSVKRAVSTPKKVSSFVREAVARMRTAPRFLSQEAWDDFASYDGPVVSGDPEGIADHPKEKALAVDVDGISR